MNSYNLPMVKMKETLNLNTKLKKKINRLWLNCAIVWKRCNNCRMFANWQCIKGTIKLIWKHFYPHSTIKLLSTIILFKKIPKSILFHHVLINEQLKCMINMLNNNHHICHQIKCLLLLTSNFNWTWRNKNCIDKINDKYI